MVKSGLSPIRLKRTQNVSVSVDVKPSQKQFWVTPPHNPDSNNVTVNSKNSKIHTYEGGSSKILKFSHKIVNKCKYVRIFSIFFFAYLGRERWLSGLKISKIHKKNRDHFCEFLKMYIPSKTRAKILYNFES